MGYLLERKNNSIRIGQLNRFESLGVDCPITIVGVQTTYKIKKHVWAEPEKCSWRQKMRKWKH